MMRDFEEKEFIGGSYVNRFDYVKFILFGNE